MLTTYPNDLQKIVIESDGGNFEFPFECPFLGPDASSSIDLYYMTFCATVQVFTDNNRPLVGNFKILFVFKDDTRQRFDNWQDVEYAVIPF
jgi:hypothetical protein